MAFTSKAKNLVKLKIMILSAVLTLTWLCSSHIYFSHFKKKFFLDAFRSELFFCANYSIVQSQFVT